MLFPVMVEFRYWLSDRLIDLVRVVHPPARDGHPKAKVWQIIEVPRRLTRGEADQIAAEVKSL